MWVVAALTMISKELLDLIRCPACKAELRFDEPAHTLTCGACRRVYPVRDGIPILLVDEAKIPGS
jgi:uncharacterized protein